MSKRKISYRKWMEYRALQALAVQRHIEAYGHPPPPGSDPLRNYDLEPAPTQTKSGEDLLARVANLKGAEREGAIVAAVVEAVRAFVDRRTARLQERIEKLEARS